MSEEEFVCDAWMARCTQDRSKFLGSYNYIMSCTLKVLWKDIRVRTNAQRTSSGAILHLFGTYIRNHVVE